MPKIINEPDSEVLSMDDVKSFLRITHTEDDSLLSALIKAARKTIELFTGKVFLTQKQEVFMPVKFLDFSFCQDLVNNKLIIPLTVSPIQSVVSVNIINGVSYFEVKDFALINNGKCYKLAINSHFINKHSVVKIDYIAGFQNVNEVPEPLKIATMMLVSDLYREKDIEIKGGIRKSIKYLIKPYINVAI